jgi:hypothetical protein
MTLVVHNNMVLRIEFVTSYCELWTAFTLFIHIKVHQINHNMWSETPEAPKTNFLMLESFKSPLKYTHNPRLKGFFSVSWISVILRGFFPAIQYLK